MPATATSSALHRLADRVGIISEYLDQTGKQTRVCSDETRVQLLAVMGIDASSDEAAERALEKLEARDASTLLAPVRVMAKHGSRPLEATLTIPPGFMGRIEWAAEVREEGGRRWRRRGRTQVASSGRAAKRLSIFLPPALEYGYHTLRVAVRSLAGQSTEATQSLIVVPSTSPRAREVLGGRSLFGIITNLYTLRSGRNWGAGDLTDLQQLVRWSASEGAGFVGLNPLHALLNRGFDVSPYSPVSRLFRNPLYIDVEAVPEFAYSEDARRTIASADFRAGVARLRAADRIDYAAVMALKMPVLRALYRTFRERKGSRGEPARAFQRYVESQGETLSDFATWSAIAEFLASQAPGEDAYDWHGWPTPFRDPRSPAVARFRADHAEDVTFHAWLQWELDSQLAAAANLAAELGMPIGLYQDLAIGTSPTGSDTWAFDDLFLEGVSIGAPPDPYAAEGQNWGLPPIDPRRLAEQGYRYWIALVRSALRHAGALRMDHVMGLFRQFWIPEGRSGKDGAYIRFPSDDLLGILALESTRHRALVVGEDLGTVPPEVPPALAQWGILSSKVLYFEREGEYDFRSASSYDACALATANTHDMPTISGFLTGRDIDLKVEVGMMSAHEAQEARQIRQRECEALVRRLVADRILPAGREPADAELRGAVHEFLCRTPSVLVGLSLDDVTGEREPVNIPGVAGDKFPSWTRRMRLGVEDLGRDPAVAAALRCAGRRTQP